MTSSRHRGALQGAVASGCPGGPPRVCLDQTHSLWCKRTDLWVAALDLHCPHRAHPGCLGEGLDSARGRREAAVAYRKPPYRTLPRVRPCKRSSCVWQRVNCCVSSSLWWVVACRHALNSWQSLSRLCLLQHTACSALYTMPSRYSKPDTLAILCDAHGEQSRESGRLWVP